MATQTIALLGLGAMGRRIAQRLLDAHYPLVIYNRTPEKAENLVKQGATLAHTPRAAAAQADIVMSMVTDIDASKSIWLDPDQGAIHGLTDHAIALESSTLTVDWTKALGTAIAHQGAAFLDAPVVGSRPQADAGQLIYLVGGDEQALATVYEVLKSIGQAVYHMGSIGNGMAMKLAVNGLFSLQVAGLAEQLARLEQQGIRAEQAMQCLSKLPITSPAMNGAGTLMMLNNHQPLFPIELVEKDLCYVTAPTTPLTAATLNLYREAIAQGYGNHNITGIAQYFESSPSPSR